MHWVCLAASSGVYGSRYWLIFLTLHCFKLSALSGKKCWNDFWHIVARYNVIDILNFIIEEVVLFLYTAFSSSIHVVLHCRMSSLCIIIKLFLKDKLWGNLYLYCQQIQWITTNNEYMQFTKHDLSYSHVQRSATVASCLWCEIVVWFWVSPWHTCHLAAWNTRQSFECVNLLHKIVPNKSRIYLCLNRRRNIFHFYENMSIFYVQ